MDWINRWRLVLVSLLGWREMRQIIGQAIAIALIAIISWTGLATLAIAEDYDKRDLLKADLSHQVLTDDSFTKANLRESNLSYTDLRGVSLFGAHMVMANLEGADLRGATLDTADLRKSNLTHALLEGAYAFNAQFDGAVIDGADFTDVLMRPDAQKLLCQVASGTNPVSGRETRATLYCP